MFFVVLQGIVPGFFTLRAILGHATRLGICSMDLWIPSRLVIASFLVEFICICIFVVGEELPSPEVKMFYCSIRSSQAQKKTTWLDCTVIAQWL